MPINTDPLAATHPDSDEAVAIAANAVAIKAGIEAGVSTNSGTAITVNAASFGDRQFIKILCTATSNVTVTLANDGVVGKVLEVVAYHATADVTYQAGVGATLLKPASASFSTTEQYEAMVVEVDSNSTDTNAVWRLVARP